MTSRRKQNIAAVSTKLRVQEHHFKYHPNRNCSDCSLCGHAITTVTHFGAWGTAKKQFVIKHLGKELPPSSCTDTICNTLMKSEMSPTEILKQVDSSLGEDNQHTNFQSFIKEYCEQDETWKFWAHFVFEDCLAYTSSQVPQLEAKDSLFEANGLTIFSV